MSRSRYPTLRPLQHRSSSTSSQPSLRRPRTPDSEEEYANQDGSKNALKRFKFNLESIIHKYDKPFRFNSDVIDIRTMKIVQDNNHVRSLADRTPETLGSNLAMPDPIDIELCRPGDDYTGADEPEEADDIENSDDDVHDSDEENVEEESEDEGEQEEDDVSEYDEEEKQPPTVENKFTSVASELLRLNSREERPDQSAIPKNYYASIFPGIAPQRTASLKSIGAYKSALTRINYPHGQSHRSRSRTVSEVSQRTASPHRLRTDSSMDRLTKILQQPLIYSPGNTPTKPRFVSRERRHPEDRF